MPLPNKLGVTIGAGVVIVCKRNQIERSYIVLSDSVSSTVGYKTGAIAHLRQTWHTPLIFVLKCTAHKVSRAWRRALQECGGGQATRPAVKRSQIGKVKLNRVVLLLEDNLYLLMTCPQVMEEVKVGVPVHSHVACLPLAHQRAFC